MAIRESFATWEGNLKEGQGVVHLGSGAFKGSYSYRSRFEEGPGTNPEELIAAAHAGCFSMDFASRLSKAGYVPRKIETTASVHFDPGPKISQIDLSTYGDVPGISREKFLEIAEEARAGCPVSKALAAVKINLTASLLE